MASVGIAVPENLSGAPVLKLTETGEMGHGGIGPLNAAEIVAPGLTLVTNAGVQTDATACAGAVIKGATQTPIAAMRASCLGNTIRRTNSDQKPTPPFFVNNNIETQASPSLS